VFFALGYIGQSEPIGFVTGLGKFYIFMYFFLIIAIFILDYFDKVYDDNRFYEEKQKREREKSR